jgi:hypothetical protein
MRRRFFLWAFWVFLLIGVAWARAWVFRPGTHHPGSYFNRGRNAAWIGVEWAREPHPAQAIAALAHDLRRRQIRYVFVYTSYLRPDGTFNPTFAHLADFVSQLRRAYPLLHIQAWIGLPLEYVDLSDAATREKIVRFCVNVVRTTGVDGIHLDPEPVPTDEENVLLLLDELREALGAQGALSIAARRIWPIWPDGPWPLVGRFAWRARYYREVARRVDQIAVMTYDSALPWAFLYRYWVRFQVIEISRAVEGTGAALFFGVPTSEERTWTHRPEAENLRSGLAGVVDGLNDAAARPAAVAGVAIYPYWETDEKEWQIYEELWLGKGDP